jgi:hypothetical protein
MSDKNIKDLSDKAKPADKDKGQPLGPEQLDDVVGGMKPVGGGGHYTETGTSNGDIDDT